MNSSNRQLRPAAYQLIALSKLMLSELNGILICDGVGVGKTISAGYVASYLSTNPRRPILIASPVMLVDKWRAELKTKFGFDARPVRSREELETAEDEIGYAELAASPVAYVLSNSLLQDRDFTTELNPQVIVVDEIHNFRNANTISFQSLHRLCGQACYRIGLTATPINNALDDLSNELNLVLPQFTALTTKATIDELWQTHNFSDLSPILTRFEKEPLKIHFARRNIRTHFVSYPAEYMRRAHELVKNRSGRKVSSGMMLDEITLYRLASSSPQAFQKALGSSGLLEPSEDQKLQRFREIVEFARGSKIIVFCEYRETVDYLERNLSSDRPLLSITGETPYSDRQGIIDMFRQIPASILILTAVGSEGLDLQFCSRIVNYDLNWNPMILEQRIGRIDRIGQEKTDVMIDNILVAGSIDERVLAVLSKKLSVIAQSVFAPQPILEIEGAQTTSGEFLTDEVVIHEEGKGAELLKALEQTSKIKLTDYGVIDALDPSFCDPHLLRDLGMKGEALPWLSNKELTEWKEDIVGSSNRLREILGAYSGRSL